MQGSPVLPPVQAGFRSGKAIVVTVVSSRSRQQSPAVGFVSCVRWNEGRCAEGDCEWAPGCVEDAQMSSKGETAYLGTENGLRKAHGGASLGSGQWTFKGSENAEARASSAHRVWTPGSSSLPCPPGVPHGQSSPLCLLQV